jgi:ABC-type multidrug transport system ATPase subunit
MRIELRGATKSFGDVVALRDLTLAIPSGAKVALVGPNGSGKSTLLRVLMGVLRATGSVRLDGLDPIADRDALAPNIAYVPQIAPQLAAPVREVVRAIAAVRGIAVEAVAETAAKLDLHLEDIASRPFRGLSGGMRHKLLIALALAAPMSLLLLDEPTASLDAEAREHFFRIFGEAAARSTLVLCSHRIEEMRHLVDHVIALNEGQLVYEGSSVAYLEERAVSVLQVCVAEPSARPWLLGHGFSAGADGWFARTVTHAEKLALLPELAVGLGTELRDVHIQELEKVDGVAPGSRHA